MPAAHHELAQAARIPVNRLRVHPRNIRTRLTQLDELAASIRYEGVIEPLVAHKKFIRKAGVQDLELIAGHRRLAAAEIAGLKTVPVIVLPTMRDDEVILAMLGENISRVAVQPDDLGRAIRTLHDEFGYDQQAIAERLGIDVVQLRAMTAGRHRPTIAAAAPSSHRTSTPRTATPEQRAAASRRARRTPRITPTRIAGLLAEQDAGTLTADAVCDRLRGALGGWTPNGVAALAPPITEQPPELHFDDSTGALTERELQVLGYMATGRSNGEIGQHLYLSEDTVKTHGRRLFRKLGARDRAHAVALGIAHGHVTLPAGSTPDIDGAPPQQAAS